MKQPIRLIDKYLSSTNPRRLWVRYLIAVFIVFSLLLGSHLTAIFTLQKSAHDAETINISGQQSALSQRILYLANRAYDTGAAEDTALLIKTVEQFEIAHHRLSGIDALPDSVRALYFSPDGPMLDNLVSAYAADARLIANGSASSDDATAALLRLQDTGLNIILMHLNDATSGFQGNAEQHAARISMIENAALYAAVIIIVIEGLLIFWPAQRSVNIALTRIEQRNAELVEVRNTVQRKNDVLGELAKKLKYSAYHDPLTGLANRKKLHAELAAILEEERYRDAHICVMHLDLDKFKEINDKLGHLVGDKVLYHAAEIICAQFRKTDLIARIGGDEFVIIATFRKSDPKDRIQQICDSLIAAIQKPMLMNGVECLVSASIGYVFADSDCNDADLLLNNADIALYEAKRAGRGIARPFTGAMRDGLENRRKLVTDIEKALDNDEFVCAMQPLVNLASGAVIGFESLARWRHPERGLLTPSKFIHIAEEMGVIDAIDEYIMMKGLDALNRLRADGFDIGYVSINASAKSMRSPDFFHKLCNAIEVRNLKPDDIVIEILETILIEEESDQAAQTIKALADKGFRTFVDDFGTGYASMGNLARLAISGLKIDRSILSDVNNERSIQVIEAILGLAKGLQLTVVAEGIETPQQYAVLKRLKCDIAQGFGISKPLEYSSFTKWLETYGRAPFDYNDLLIGKTL